MTLDRMFSPQDMDRIRRGVVPEAMEDKWFIYWKEDMLFFHRSWTGFCTYVVRFAADGDAWMMMQADVNRDPRQYQETDTDRDARLIAYLIDVVLLHRHVEFPPADSPQRKLPRQVDTLQVDSRAVFGLGKNVRGGTRPRLSCGRSSL